jgi:hypothetical protein
VLVLLNARNFPMFEDWGMVPALTGHQDDFLSSLWSPVNERLHHLPVSRTLRRPAAVHLDLCQGK